MYYNINSIEITNLANDNIQQYRKNIIKGKKKAFKTERG